MRLKSIIKGAGSFVYPRWRMSAVGVEGAYSAAGSYGLFMRHALALAGIGRSFEDKLVLEYGPGATLGLGFAALICGAKRYYSYDLIDHTDADRNLAVFDELLQMFERRAALPSGGFHEKIFPILQSHEFPIEALPEDLLRRTLLPQRINSIREDIKTRGGVFVVQRSSRDIAVAVLDEPVDVIISESVLEHVDDLPSTYAFFARALAADGVMAHLIDYTSHNLADEWNGHWVCAPKLWSIVRGKREFLINRKPHQYHLDLLAENGMRVIQTSRLHRVDGATRDGFANEFRQMSRLDATTSLAQIVVARN